MLNKRKLFLVVIFFEAAISVGCATTSNSFISYEVIKAPEEIVGVWTGSSLGATTTYVINSDGTGIVCNDFNSTVNIDRLKYIGDGNLAYGKGFTFSIERDGNVLNSSWYGSGMEMVRDPELKHAAITCIEPLKSYL